MLSYLHPNGYLQRLSSTVHFSTCKLPVRLIKVQYIFGVHPIKFPSPMRFTTYMTAVACAGTHAYIHPGYPQQITVYILLEGDSSCHVTCPVRNAHIKCESVKAVMVCMLAVCMAKAPVQIFKPKYRLGHPEDHLLLLSEITFFGSKYPRKK